MVGGGRVYSSRSKGDGLLLIEIGLSVDIAIGGVGWIIDNKVGSGPVDKGLMLIEIGLCVD